MSDYRSLPLRNLAKQGRFGSASISPGVTLSIVHPVSLVQILARKGAAKSVAETLASLKSVRVMQAGPQQYYVQASGKLEGWLAADLKKRLGSKASVVDQSHGRVVIRIDGPKSRAVLAKGTPVDLHPEQFTLDQSAQTQMAHVGVHITRIGKNAFLVSVFRGFSESLWEWLESAAAEFAFQIN